MYDSSWLDSAGRLLFVAFFLVAGLINLTPASIKDHIDRMAALGTPFPAAAFWLGLAIQFTGCALLLFDVRPDLGAGCLIVFTVLATAIFHRFWQRTDPLQRRMARLNLMSNVAILAGLLLLLENVR